MPDIIVHSVKKSGGIAGQTQFTAVVEYPGEPRSTVSFVGSVAYGGPVVMVSETGAQVYVRDPGRFGKFGPAWVRNFFKDGEK